MVDLAIPVKFENLKSKEQLDNFVKEVQCKFEGKANIKLSEMLRTAGIPQLPTPTLSVELTQEGISDKDKESIIFDIVQYVSDRCIGGTLPN